jgi:hypothetical protein
LCLFFTINAISLAIFTKMICFYLRENIIKEIMRGREIRYNILMFISVSFQTPFYVDVIWVKDWQQSNFFGRILHQHEACGTLL